MSIEDTRNNWLRWHATNLSNRVGKTTTANYLLTLSQAYDEILERQELMGEQAINLIATKDESPLAKWHKCPEKSFEVECVANGFILTLSKPISAGNYIVYTNEAEQSNQRTYVFADAAEMAAWIKKNMK